MKTTSACVGCHNNFYNGNNDLGVRRCWSADSAVIKTRFTLSVNTPMHIKEAYHKQQLPSCYKRKGYVHLDAIPHYAQSRDQREAERILESQRDVLEAKRVVPSVPSSALDDSDLLF